MLERAVAGSDSSVSPGSSDGSAVFRGCFRRPNNLSLALPVTVAMPNMSVDKCVDLCTEKVSWGCSLLLGCKGRVAGATKEH